MKAESVARRTRKRRPPAMKMKVLPQIMTEVITQLEDYFLSLKPESENYGEEARRTAHSLATVIGTLTRTLEVTDFEQRLDQLQRRLSEREAGATPKPTRDPSQGVATRPVN
jgi:hypothetical protein